jgi:hypothetical protein
MHMHLHVHRLETLRNHLATLGSSARRNVWNITLFLRQLALVTWQLR